MLLLKLLNIWFLDQENLYFIQRRGYTKKLKNVVFLRCISIILQISVQQPAIKYTAGCQKCLCTLYLILYSNQLPNWIYVAYDEVSWKYMINVAWALITIYARFRDFILLKIMKNKEKVSVYTLWNHQTNWCIFLQSHTISYARALVVSSIWECERVVILLFTFSKMIGNKTSARTYTWTSCTARCSIQHRKSI